METPGQTAARLLTVLEELIEQEGRFLRGGHYDLAVETRARAAPFVQRLCATADLPDVAALRPRIDVLIELSGRHAALLQDQLAEIAEEIRRTDQARQRAGQVVPAYARAARRAAPRFLAAG